MSTTLTNDQITAGAAVLGDNGEPIGRNTAIMVFDAMATAGAPVDELADAEAAVRFTRAAPAVAGADLDLSDLARLFASSHETGKPVLLSASACGLLFDAMTTAAPAAPLEERQRAGLMAHTERKRGDLEQRGYGVIGYVMQGARGDRCTVTQGAVHWQVDPVGASTVLTDERIDVLWREATSIGIETTSCFTRHFARAIEREVAAQVGQVAVPEAWGLYAEVDGVMVLQYPVRFSKSECEADARIYVDGTKIEIRPMVSFSPAKESK